MSLANTFSDKVRIIDDIVSKMTADERKIMLRKMIKDDMKTFFEVIFEEQKWLEKETGIDGAYLVEMTECKDTSEKIWIDGKEVKDIESVRPENIGQVSDDDKNNWFLKKLGDDNYDGFLGYINSEEGAT